MALSGQAKQERETYLVLDGVTRRFGTVTALDGVSLALPEGGVTCLVGRSGCGKSTLLRVIAGIERPDGGSVTLNGRTLTGSGVHVEPEDRQVGLMFQDYALFPHLSVTDNILFGLRRQPRREAQARGAEIIQRLGLGALAKRFPHMLSGGEQQRVALARALAPNPKVLLMDEPFSNLDRVLREAVRDETLRLLRDQDTTVIMVTHDPEEALASGDRVVLMRDGAIVQQGTSDELYDRPVNAYAAEFFCSYNKIEGACWNGFLHTPLGRFEAPGRSDGQAATVYVRPNCLRLCSGEEGIHCTVLDCALVGEIEQIRVSIDAHGEPLRLRSTDRRRLQTGDRTRVSVAAEDVFVF